MKPVTGTVKNYFAVYHVPAVLLVIAFYILVLLPANEPGESPSRLPVFLAYFGTLNLMLGLLIYTPFYMNRISVLFRSGDAIYIDGYQYAATDVQSIVRFEKNYFRNQQIHYLLKLGSAKDFRFFKVVDRASLYSLHPLVFFGIRQFSPTVVELRDLGVSVRVQDQYGQSYGKSSSINHDHREH